MKEKLKREKREVRKGKGPKVFVVSGPGGAGKTTLVNKLFETAPAKNSFVQGISVTTRERRLQEKEGKDYFFVSPGEFLRLEKKKFFLESQRILEDYYGTPRLFYKVAKLKRKDLVLCIDVKGAMYLKKEFKAGGIITIFIAAPTAKELYRRMEKRKDSSKGQMQKRVTLAKKELQFAKYYDYVIVNKSLESTLKKLQELIFSC